MILTCLIFSLLFVNCSASFTDIIEEYIKPFLRKVYTFFYPITTLVPEPYPYVEENDYESSQVDKYEYEKVEEPEKVEEAYAKVIEEHEKHEIEDVEEPQKVKDENKAIEEPKNETVREPENANKEDIEEVEETEEVPVEESTTTTTTTTSEPSTTKKIIRNIKDPESWKWEFVTRVTPGPVKWRRMTRMRYNRYYPRRSGCSGSFVNSLVFIVFTVIFIY